MIAEEEDPLWSNIDTGDPTPNSDPPDSPNLLQAQISLNSLSGHLGPEALRLMGLISDHRVIVLVDGGSTHNFVQPQVVTSLRLPCQTISTPLRVMVGNGQYLECVSICEDVLVSIQDHTFTLDLYILPISGANIILGVQWLKTLGPVLTNYNTLSMQFFHQDQLVELKGDHTSTSGTLTQHQFRHLYHHRPITSYFHITLSLDTHVVAPNHEPPPEIQQLLTSYELLFYQPQTLPPPRTHRSPYPPASPLPTCQRSPVSLPPLSEA